MTTGVVPRWEWRTFGEEFGAADDRLAALAPERAQASDETYVLSREFDASVKLRDGVLDVKRLEEVDADGLERWRPVLKLTEPFSSADVGELAAILRIEAAPLRPEYTFAELLAELVVPRDDLEAVEVHKEREHFTVGGCMVERSLARVEGGTRRTLAIESEEPALVSAAVRELGLETRRNVSVPRGLGALVGFGARRYAAIDVGTNSVKLNVGERAADGEWSTLADHADVTRLGEGRDESGRLAPDPVARTVAAIEAMVDEARRNGAEAIAAVGTAGLRSAPNRDELIDAARESTGVEVEPVGGEEEARLAYLGVISALELGTGAVVVFDSGGGSSQFTFGRGAQVEEQFSVDVGAARLTERFGLDRAVSEEELAAALDAIADGLARLDGRPTPERLIGLGGAVTNIAAVKHGLAAYDADVVQGTVLDRAEVERQLELYRTRTADERREIVGLQPKRAEVILAGACVVRTVLAKLGSDSFTVSDRGLRHGLLAERFGV